MKCSDALRQQLLDDGFLILKVRVTPRCSKSEVAGLTLENVLQAKLAAIPEKGRANEELRRLLGDFFGVPKGHVDILSGETARHKRVRISR